MATIIIQQQTLTELQGLGGVGFARKNVDGTYSVEVDDEVKREIDKRGDADFVLRRLAQQQREKTPA